MLYLALSQIVQMRLPMFVLLQIFSDMFRQQDVSRIPAIHHALRHVDPRAGDIRPLVHIDHTADGAAVHAHSQLETGKRFQSAADFQRTFNRRFGTVVKD